VIGTSERSTSVRKQYHFWPSERGLLAWEVDRLISLAKGLARRRVALSEIRELEEVYWFDGETERPTCRKVLEHIRLIDEADLSFPIILGADGRVMDGMHRVAKAVLQGRQDIEAVQFSSDPTPDFVGCPSSRTTKVSTPSSRWLMSPAEIRARRG
jgi:hypothetical protein